MKAPLLTLLVLSLSAYAAPPDRDPHMSDTAVSGNLDTHINQSPTALGISVGSPRVGGNNADISISGVSSGGAMAVQYAIAHSNQVRGVAAIAAPGWGCAGGRLSTAINTCMCNIHNDVHARNDLLDDLNNIDALQFNVATSSETTNAIGERSREKRALKEAYVFYSEADTTVAPASAKAGIAFLTKFLNSTPKVESIKNAKHGIISPEGTDACDIDIEGRTATYVRNCGEVDNAKSIFFHLFGRLNPAEVTVPAGTLFAFDQIPLIDAAKVALRPDDLIASDTFPKSEARKNFDLAPYGYMYVPSTCGPGKRKCPIHVALHGCRQDALTFAKTAGYNRWADRYGVIVVYPALVPRVGPAEPKSVCTILAEQRNDPLCRIFPGAACGEIPASADYMLLEANDRGCWDWWGYLDIDQRNHRYLSRGGPQIKVIELILEEAVKLPASRGAAKAPH